MARKVRKLTSTAKLKQSNSKQAKITKQKLLGRKTTGRKTEEESAWQMLAVKESSHLWGSLRTCGPGGPSLKGHLTCYLLWFIEHAEFIACQVQGTLMGSAQLPREHVLLGL